MPANYPVSVCYGKNHFLNKLYPVKNPRLESTRNSCKQRHHAFRHGIDVYRIGSLIAVPAVIIHRLTALKRVNPAYVRLIACALFEEANRIKNCFQVLFYINFL